MLQDTCTKKDIQNRKVSYRNHDYECARIRSSRQRIQSNENIPFSSSRSFDKVGHAMLYIPTNHAKINTVGNNLCRNESGIHLSGSVGRVRRLDQTRDVSATHWRSPGFVQQKAMRLTTIIRVGPRRQKQAKLVLISRPLQAGFADYFGFPVVNLMLLARFTRHIC